MKVTYLIGNGFDINIGIKSRYQDFYNYMKESESVNSGNEIFNNIIKDCFKIEAESISDIDWADFEIAIGKYVDKLKSESELESFFDDYVEFVDEFTDYIDKQLKNVNLNIYSLKSQKTFYDSIKNPIKLDERERNILENVYSKYSNNTQERDFIIFNYTKVFESITDTWLKKQPNNISLKIGNPIHVHGYTQEQTLMGVNDETQLLGEFANDHDLQMMLIKTKSNEQSSSMRKERAEKLIEESNLIIVFGMSIGDSDKYWWGKIIKNLENNPSNNVIVYAYDHDISHLNKHIHKMHKKKNEWKEKLLNHNENQVNLEIQDQIFIHFDTKKIFNFTSLISDETNEFKEENENTVMN